MHRPFFRPSFLRMMAFLPATSAWAQDTAAAPPPTNPLVPGHSAHGEGFSEGPRRRGPLLKGMGDVDFPVTAASAETQIWFNQGVGQLHGFWYWEAERSFRTVLALDPGCTMAYWGLAMANLENMERGREFLTKVTDEALKKLTERERQWIAATKKFYEPQKDDEGNKKAAREFVKDLEDIASLDPGDIEARAFILCFHWWNMSRRGIQPSSRFALDAIGQTVLAKNPRHPAHHYFIHLWDGDHAERALLSASMCGQAAPGIAHMWHMSGHIYSDLDRWADAAWQQEAAARVDHQQMIRSHTMPDQIHNFAHNSEWLVRNLNNLGRVRDALTISSNLIEMPRIPRSSKVTDKPDQKLGSDRSAWDQGRSRLRDTLLSWELWDLALKLGATPWLSDDGDFTWKWQRAQLLGVASFRTGNVAGGEKNLTDLQTQTAALRKERAAAVDAAEQKARDEKKDAKAIQEAMAEALKDTSGKLNALEPVIAEMQVLADLAHDRKDEARKGLDRLKGVHDQRLVAIHQALGDVDKAVELATNFASRSDDQVQPQALLTDILWRAGKKDEALKAFATLRGLAAPADPETPLLARLAPVAEAAGCKGDWRQPAPARTDTGIRPPMDSLGPQQWHGWQAATWTATGADGKTFDSQSLAGHPYVVVFFLGGACSHCNAQLKVFGEKSADFTAAGLPLLAVTSDPVQDLAESENKPPFPVYSGADGAAFKAADAWDDFENKPLHATLFVDATGRVRWQHSGYEPFMKPEFLLEEAQRLLKFDDSRPSGLAAASPAAGPEASVN
ncbi:MAG: redoxin domain-containing protein [Verrucomicrobiota bacterium]